MLFNYGIGQLGVDYSIPSTALPAGALADSANIVTTEAGLITGRGGTLKLNNSPVGDGISRLTGLFEHRAGTTLKIVCSYQGSLAYYNSSHESVYRVPGRDDNRQDDSMGELRREVNLRK